MRGENSAPWSLRLTVGGSSPHARGKLVWPCWKNGAARLIPACAGKTPHLLPCSQRSRAHPRMRGENEHIFYRYGPCAGSSPHARGKRLTRPTIVIDVGLIPACAGKTTTPPGLICKGGGSSPHARGKQSDVVDFTHAVGLIPACAGKTWGLDSLSRW